MPLRNSRTRASGGILAVAAATVLVLGHFAYLRGRSTDPTLRFLDPRQAPSVDDAGLAIAAEYAIGSNEEDDVLFIGDSACHDGIDPERLAKLTEDLSTVRKRQDRFASKGLKAFNLGTQQGAGPIGMLVLLKGYLQHHPKPRVVVMCLSPFCLESSIGAMGHPERFIANYGPDVEGVVAPLEVASYFIRSGAIGSWSSGDRKFLDWPLVGMEKETYRSLRQRLADSRGFFALPSEHGLGRALDMPGPAERVHPDWDGGLSSIVTACAESGVRLVIRFAPISSDVRSARDWSQLEQWSSGIESSGVTVGRPIVLAYDPALCWDQVHLNAAGVEKFMPLVAKDVQAVLGK